MPGAPRTNPAAPRGAQADLAARLRHGASALQERLNRRDTLIELIRSVNATLEPKKVADALIGHAQGWFPAACIVVAVQDGPQRASIIPSWARASSTEKVWFASRGGSRSTTKNS